MARTVNQINDSIVASYVSNMAAIGITITPTEWSRRNLQKLLIFVIAIATAIFEQLLDNYVSAIETKIAQAAPQTAAWFKAQMLKFQFSATDPQILQFDETEFYPYYPVVDTDLQVIKYVSVVAGTFGTTRIKVAAQVAGLPADLDTTYTGALAAAQNYVDTIAISGITYYVVSGNADRLYVEATIYYQGGYSAVIQDTVIAAIDAFLAALPFDGMLLLSNLELAIKSVAGVNDVVFSNVQGRSDGTAYGSGTNLVVTNTVTSRLYNTSAGYIISEDTATHTLADSLTFISE